MLPECLVVALIVFPVRLHVVEELSLAERRNNGRYIGVRAGRVAARVVRTVAVVGPENKQSAVVRKLEDQGSERNTIVHERSSCSLVQWQDLCPKTASAVAVRLAH